jgi:TP901 family phage tail tape measure protein
MAELPTTLRVGVTIDRASLSRAERDVQRSFRNVQKLAKSGKLLGSAYTAPLGRITHSADEFTKSLEASNARVLAFGASAGAIYAVEAAFSALVRKTIEVEKSLKDINVILGLTSSDLRGFSRDLFKIAGETGQSFAELAKSATEFSRQGLGAAETLKRTRDAMILARLAGMDVVASTEALTAAMNTFNDAALTSTVIVNKLANVDAKFAVSSEDLAEAIKRVGSSAIAAGVSFDSLLATITAAQQKTARGGRVIGNSFKTIFTRIQRPRVIKQLQDMGVAVKDMSGNMKPAMEILQNFAGTYDNLSDSQKALTAEMLGGVFQVNVLKATMSDLSSEYSIYSQALKVAANTTNEAVDRNEELNKTLAALLNETMNNVTAFAAAIGKTSVGPAIEKILGTINSIIEAFTIKDPESWGAKLGEGLLSGIGKVLSGPGLILLAALLAKIGANFLKFTIKAVQTFTGLNAAAQEQAGIQTVIQNILIKNPEIINKATASAEGLLAVENAMLKVMRSQNAAMASAASLSANMAANLTAATKVGGGRVGGKKGAKASGGFIPNFAMKTADRTEAIGAMVNGYEAGETKRAHIKGIGQIIYNSKETKKDVGLGQDAILPPKNSLGADRYKKAFEQMHGYDPYTASGGFVPNFTAPKTKPKTAAGSLTVPSSQFGGVALIVSKDLGFGKLGFTKEALAKGKITVPDSMMGIKSKQGKSGDVLNVTGIRQYVPQSLSHGDISDKSKNSRFDDMIKQPLGGAVRAIAQKLLKPATKENFPNINKIMKLVKKDKSGYPQFAGRIFEAAINTAIWSKDMAGSNTWDHNPNQFSGNNKAVTDALIGNKGKGRVGVHIASNKYIDSKLSGLGSDAALKSMRGKLTGTAQIRNSIQQKLNAVAETSAVAQKKGSLTPNVAITKKGVVKSGKWASAGFIPNFADGLAAAVQREAASPGIAAGQVKVGHDKRLYASGGLGVFNSTEGNLGNAIDSHMSMGKNINSIQKAGASGGFIPNFAGEHPLNQWLRSSAGIRTEKDPTGAKGLGRTDLAKMQKAFDNLHKAVEKGPGAVDKAYKNLRKFGSAAGLSRHEMSSFHKSLRTMTSQLTEQAKIRKTNITAAKSTGKALERLKGTTIATSTATEGTARRAAATRAAVSGGGAAAAAGGGGMGGMGMMAAFMLPSILTGMVSGATSTAVPSQGAVNTNRIMDAISGGVMKGMVSHMVAGALGDAMKKGFEGLGKKGMTAGQVGSMTGSKGFSGRHLSTAARARQAGGAAQGMMGRAGTGMLATKVGGKVASQAFKAVPYVGWAIAIADITSELASVFDQWNVNVKAAEGNLAQANFELTKTSETFNEFFKLSADLNEMTQGYKKPDPFVIEEMKSRQMETLDRMDPKNRQAMIGAMKRGASTKELEHIAKRATEDAKRETDYGKVKLYAHRMRSAESKETGEFSVNAGNDLLGAITKSGITATGINIAKDMARTISRMPFETIMPSGAVGPNVDLISRQNTIGGEKVTLGNAVTTFNAGDTDDEMVDAAKELFSSGSWTGGWKDSFKKLQEIMDKSADLGNWEDEVGEVSTQFYKQFDLILEAMGKENPATKAAALKIRENMKLLNTEETEGSATVLYEMLTELNKSFNKGAGDIAEYQIALKLHNERLAQTRKNVVNFSDRMFAMSKVLQDFTNQMSFNIDVTKMSTKAEMDRANMMEKFAGTKAAMFGNDFAMTQFNADVAFRQLDRQEVANEQGERMSSTVGITKAMSQFAGTFAKVSGRMGQFGLSPSKLTEKERLAWAALADMEGLTDSFGKGFVDGQIHLEEFITGLENSNKMMSGIYTGAIHPSAAGVPAELKQFTKEDKSLKERLNAQQHLVKSLRQISADGKANLELNQRSTNIERKNVYDRMKEGMEVQRIQREVSWGGGFQANLMATSLDHAFKIQDKANLVKHFGQDSAVGKQLQAETDFAMAKQLKTFGYRESDIDPTAKKRMIQTSAENMMRLGKMYGIKMDPEVAARRAAMQFQATFKEESPAELIRRYLQDNVAPMEAMKKMGEAAVGSGIFVVPGKGAIMQSYSPNAGGGSSRTSPGPGSGGSAQGTNVAGTISGAGSSTSTFLSSVSQALARAAKVFQAGARAVQSSGGMSQAASQPSGPATGSGSSRSKPQNQRGQNANANQDGAGNAQAAGGPTKITGSALTGRPTPKIPPIMKKNKFDVEVVAAKLFEARLLKFGTVDFDSSARPFDPGTRARKDLDFELKEGDQALFPEKAIALIMSQLERGAPGHFKEGITDFSEKVKKWLREQYDLGPEQPTAPMVGPINKPGQPVAPKKGGGGTGAAGAVFGMAMAMQNLPEFKDLDPMAQLKLADEVFKQFGPGGIWFFSDPAARQLLPLMLNKSGVSLPRGFGSTGGGSSKGGGGKLKVVPSRPNPNKLPSGGGPSGGGNTTAKGATKGPAHVPNWSDGVGVTILTEEMQRDPHNEWYDQDRFGPRHLNPAWKGGRIKDSDGTIKNYPKYKKPPKKQSSLGSSSTTMTTSTGASLGIHSPSPQSSLDIPNLLSQIAVATAASVELLKKIEPHLHGSAGIGASGVAINNALNMGGVIPNVLGQMKKDTAIFAQVTPNIKKIGDIQKATHIGRLGAAGATAAKEYGITQLPGKWTDPKNVAAGPTKHDDLQAWFDLIKKEMGAELFDSIFEGIGAHRGPSGGVITPGTPGLSRIPTMQNAAGDQLVDWKELDKILVSHSTRIRKEVEDAHKHAIMAAPFPDATGPHGRPVGATQTGSLKTGIDDTVNGQRLDPAADTTGWAGQFFRLMFGRNAGALTPKVGRAGTVGNPNRADMGGYVTPGGRPAVGEYEDTPLSYSSGTKGLLEFFKKNSSKLDADVIAKVVKALEANMPANQEKIRLQAELNKILAEGFRPAGEMSTAEQEDESDEDWKAALKKWEDTIEELGKKIKSLPDKEQPKEKRADTSTRSLLIGNLQKQHGIGGSSQLTDASAIADKFKSLTTDAKSRDLMAGGGFTVQSRLIDMQWKASAAIASSNISIDEQIDLYDRLAKSSTDLTNSKLTEAQQITEFGHVVATAMREIAAEQLARGEISTGEYRQQIGAENEAAIRNSQYGSKNAGRSFGGAILYDNKDMLRDFDMLVGSLAVNLRDGITNAFEEAIYGSKKLKEAFGDMFKDLAKSILSGMMKMAFQRLFGAMAGAAMGTGSGWARGGLVEGGSGVRDDVPARLMGGEFVVKKSMVDKYGSGFLSALNSGSIRTAAGGGSSEGAGYNDSKTGKVKYEDGEQHPMANRYVYNNPTKPTEGHFEVDPRMSAYALTDPDNPQNDLKFERYENLTSYIEEKEEYEKMKAEALQQFEDNKRRQARGALIQTAMTFAIMGLANKIHSWQAGKSNAVVEKYNRGETLTPKEMKRFKTAVKGPLGRHMDPTVRANILEDFHSQSSLNLDTGFSNDFRRMNDLPNMSPAGGNRISAKYIPGTWGGGTGATGPRGDTVGGFFGLKEWDQKSYFHDPTGAKFIQKRAQGGMHTSDNIPAMLTGGEFVMNKGVVDKYGIDFFNRLNQGNVSAFQSGGLVGGSDASTVAGGGAGEMTNNITITVNIDKDGNTNSNTEGGTDESSGKQLAKRVHQVVIGTLIEEKRPGGLLYGAGV